MTTVQSDRAIIFDLGSTLLHTNYFTVVSLFGIRNIMRYAWCSQDPIYDVKKALYRVLEMIPACPKPCITHDEDGDLIPLSMRDWFCGWTSSAQILNQVEQILQDQNQKEHVHRYMVSMVNQLARLMFIPERLAASQIYQSAGLRLLGELRKKGIPLYILSNYDLETYQVLRRRYPELFGIFTACIISGNIGFVKPDPRAYDFFELLPYAHYIFVDDQEDNLATAASLGMVPVLCPQERVWDGLYTIPNICAVQAQLKDILGIK